MHSNQSPDLANRHANMDLDLITSLHHNVNSDRLLSMSLWNSWRKRTNIEAKDT